MGAIRIGKLILCGLEVVAGLLGAAVVLRDKDTPEEVKYAPNEPTAPDPTPVQTTAEVVNDEGGQTE